MNVKAHLFRDEDSDTAYLSDFCPVGNCKRWISDDAMILYVFDRRIARRYTNEQVVVMPSREAIFGKPRSR